MNFNLTDKGRQVVAATLRTAGKDYGKAREPQWVDFKGTRVVCQFEFLGGETIRIYLNDDDFTANEDDDDDQ